jgi:hypothetical protein
MRIHDGIYSWEGFGGKLKLSSGCCWLRLYDLRRAAAGMAFLRPFIAIVADVPESRMSVRSCAGHIATSVARDFKIDPQRMLYIEFYPESIYGEHRDRKVSEKYDVVDFNWTVGGAIQPRWRTLQPPLLDAVRKMMEEAAQ